MRLTIHASTPTKWWELCARTAARFDTEYPAPHKDCIYSYTWGGEEVVVYVTRTPTAGMSARAWPDTRGETQ